MKKELLIAAFLTAVPGSMFVSPAAAAPADRRLCDNYPLASPHLTDDSCRSNHGPYVS